MAEPSHLHPCEMIDDEPQWEVERVLNHRLAKRGRKSEYLLAFVGYGPEHNTNLWQDDVENCEQFVKDYWATKPESERLVVLFSPTCAHARHMHGLICLLPPCCMQSCRVRSSWTPGSIEHEALSVQLFLSVSMHSRHSCPRHLHLLYEVSVYV